MPLPISLDESKRRLEVFMKDLWHVLNSIAKNPINILPGEQHRLYRKTLSEVQPAFQAFFHRSDMNNETVEPSGYGGIESAGLTGHSLEFKLSNFYRPFNQLLNYAQSPFSIQEEIDIAPPWGIQASPPPDISLGIPAEPVHVAKDKNDTWWTPCLKLISRVMSAAAFIIGSLVVKSEMGEKILEVIQAVKESVDFTVDIREGAFSIKEL